MLSLNWPKPCRRTAVRAQLVKLEQLPRPEDVPPSESKVQAARANADRARDEYERTRARLARHAASEEEAVGKRLRYEEAAQQLHRAERAALLLAGAWKPDIEVARAEVAQAEAEVAQIRTEIDRAVVRVPIDGQVLQVNVRVGERVGDQAQQGLMVIGRVPPIHVRPISTSTISPSFTTTRRPCFNCEAKTIATIRSDSCGLNLTWSARSGSPATTPSESTPRASGDLRSRRDRRTGLCWRAGGRIHRRRRPGRGGRFSGPGLSPGLDIDWRSALDVVKTHLEHVEIDDGKRP